MGSCLTICQTCLPCPPTEWVNPCVPCLLIYDCANGGFPDVFLGMVSMVLVPWEGCYSREWGWNSRVKVCRITPGEGNDSRVSLQELDFGI